MNIVAYYCRKLTVNTTSSIDYGWIWMKVRSILLPYAHSRYRYRYTSNIIIIPSFEEVEVSDHDLIWWRDTIE